jgi:hypothetical protein
MRKRIAAFAATFVGLALSSAVAASALPEAGTPSGASSAGATAELTVTSSGNVAQATAACTGPGASGRVDFGDGTVVALTTASGTVNHAYQTPGTHTVTLTCADQNGSSSTSSVTVTTTPGQSNPAPPTTTSTTPAPAQMPLGRTVLLAARSKTRSCTVGVNPDRRCSPGAYYSALTKVVLCSSSFHASALPSVNDATSSAVEREYGLRTRHGSKLEIDRIVPLELGGSNDIANLFPQKASSHSGSLAKDKLENKLHAMVCAGQMGLRAAQRGIASNWHALYVRIVASAH